MEKAFLYPLKRPVKSEVIIPGSKSYTNRALVMAVLADGVSKIQGYSESDDSIRLLEALKIVGVKIEKDKDKITVYGNGGKFKKFKGSVNMHHAGTSSRFFISLAALIPGEVIVDGSKRLRQRPVKTLIKALQDLGVKIEYLENKGNLPIKVYGGNIKGGEISIKGTVSSQFFTSLLLVAPVLKNGLKINVLNRQISKSYIDMTVGGLKSFGVKVLNDNYKSYTVNEDEKYTAANYKVEGDASGCSYLWSIAAATGSTIKVRNISPDSTQGDVKYADLLKQMGCKINSSTEESWIEVQGNDNLKSITADMGLMPDTAQTLAVVGAFADGVTKITGLSTLKVKETDRLEAAKSELDKMGIQAQTTADSMEIIGGIPQGAEIDTYKDHRMAMSFAVAGSRVNNMIINNPDVVEKSFPTFWEVLRNIGLEVKLV